MANGHLWLEKFRIVLVGLDNEQFQVVDKMSSLSHGWNEQLAMW